MRVTFPMDGDSSGADFSGSLEHWIPVDETPIKKTTQRMRNIQNPLPVFFGQDPAENFDSRSCPDTPVDTHFFENKGTQANCNAMQQRKGVVLLLPT
jgi:hypothetical protein